MSLVRLGVACAILIPYVALRPGAPVWQTFIAAFVAFGLGRVVELLWMPRDDDGERRGPRRGARPGPVFWLIVGFAAAGAGVYLWAQAGKADRQRAARERANEQLAARPLVSPPADAAPAQPESPTWWIEVPEGERSHPFTVKVVLRDGRGQREIVAQQTQRKRLHAAIRGVDLVSATVAGEALAEFDGELSIDLDTYTPILDRVPGEMSVKTRPDDGPSRELVFDVEVTDAHGRTGRGSLTVFGSGADNVAFYRELYAISKGGLSWAADYDAAAPPHPIMWLSASRDLGVFGDEVDLDTGKYPDLPSMSIDQRFLPDFPKVRDVQLVAVGQLRKRKLGTCRECAGFDYETYPCDRSEWVEDVTVYAARSGKRIAHKKFRGAPPPKCTPGISYFDTSGELPIREVADWLNALYAGKAK